MSNTLNLSILEKLLALQARLGVQFRMPGKLGLSLIDATWEGKGWADFHAVYSSQEEKQPRTRRNVLLAIGELTSKNLGILTDMPSSGNITTNSSLALVGDTLLRTVVTEVIFQNRKGISVGQLADRVDSYLTNQHLSNAGLDMGLTPFIFMCPNPLEGTGRKLEYRSVRPLKYVADAMEAIIASIHLESGYTATSEFIRRVLIDPYPNLRIERRSRGP